MKKLLLVIALICAAYCCPVYGQDELNVDETVTVAQFESLLNEVTDTYTMYSMVDVLNIRKEPSVESKILDQAKINTNFEVVVEFNGWSMITTEDGYAYIKSEYLSDTEISLKYLGRFKITHYCCEPYKHICGDGKGLTRTGIPVHPGLISVDPSVIPLGSTVVINGIEYQAEDTGGMIKGNKIDMAVATHDEAKQLGVYWADVFLEK